MAITADQLSGLADQVPDVDKQAQAQAAAARRIQLQQAMASTPLNTNASDAASQIAQAGEQAAATSAVQGAQQQQQQLGQIANTAVASAADTQQTEQTARETAQQVQLAGQASTQTIGQTAQDIAARKQVSQADIESAARLQRLGIDQDNTLNMLTLKQSEDVSKLGRDVKQQLFDSRLQFTTDEQGRKFTNERQLADYTVATAVNQEALKEKMQVMQEAGDRANYLLKAAQSKLEQALGQNSAMGQQRLDEQTKIELTNALAAMKREVARNEATAKNRAMVISGALGVAGAVAGGVVGSAAGPAGTVVGVGAGTALGTGLGSVAAGAIQ